MVHTFWCSLEGLFESEVYVSRAPPWQQRLLTAWDVHGSGGIRPSCQTLNWFRLWNFKLMSFRGIIPCPQGWKSCIKPLGPTPAPGTLHTSSRPACPSSFYSGFCGLVLSGEAKPMTHFLQFYPTHKLQGESCWISELGQLSLQSWSFSKRSWFTCEHSWNSLVEKLELLSPVWGVA